VGAALLLALMAAQPASAAGVPTFDVAEVAAKIVALDGKVMRLRGWVSPGCYKFGCGLVSRFPKNPAQPDLVGISIDYDEAFETKLQSVVGAEVVIEGRIDATCRRPHVICTDRAPDFHPYRIVRVIQRSPDQP
jgi:hypothetical protein